MQQFMVQSGGGLGCDLLSVCTCFSSNNSSKTTETRMHYTMCVQSYFLKRNLSGVKCIEKNCIIQTSDIQQFDNININYGITIPKFALYLLYLRIGIL
jgi:hypothetical protein